ncbi:hypothetical protein Leryth_017094 [Lithospermum erythrorhizon]|nr:hypothetical protein Leryth_017094 [Lithospermum erythrorhizon]
MINMIYNFNFFEETIEETIDPIDILRFVANVKKWYTIHAKGGAQIEKREITIVDDKLKMMTMILWGDYATNHK